MCNEKNLIPQTNRTILFVKINENKPNLYSSLSGGVSDELTKKQIKNDFVVKSFDEFLDKFEPTIYYVPDKDKDGEPTINYTLSKFGQPIVLRRGNDALDMLCQLLDSKKSIGQMNVEFDYEKLLELITPRNTINKIKKIRADLNYLFSEYEKLPEGSPKRKELGNKLNKIFEANRENYNNIPALMTIALGDIQETKKKIESLSLSNESQDEGSKPNFQLTFSKNGDVEVKELPPIEDENQIPQISDQSKSAQNLIKLIGEDYNQQSSLQNYKKEPFVENLLKKVFSLEESSTLPELNENMKKNHDQYLSILTKEKQNFFNSITPLLQTILGVKLFFDQYKEGHKGNDDRPELLITNCSASDFSDDDGKKRLSDFLSELNSKVDNSETVWFAIVPNISSNTLSENTNSNKDYALFESEEKESNVFVNCDLNHLAILSDILKDHKVLTFFNFNPEPKNTFEKITSNFKGMMDATKDLEKNSKSAEYLVHCLPNLTVIPSGKRYNVGTRIIENGNFNDDNKEEFVQIPGIYIDASYVACGLAAAWQSPAFLKSRFSKDEVSIYHGVRFDIEKNENKLNLYSSLPREITGFTGDFNDYINKNQYGLLFSSDKYQPADTKIPKERIFIAKSRTLAKNIDFEKDGYKQLYKVLTNLYLIRLITANCNGNVTKTGLEEIISDQEHAWINKNWKKTINTVNGIIQDGDKIEFNESTNKIDISYKGAEETLEIEINEE
ncbi:MAG: hypothetical protein WC963_05320 [Bacilli bacterium]|jgi:hypothetical protein